MKKLFVAMMSLFLLVAMIGCSNNQSDDSATLTADSDIAYIKEKGKLIVGITNFEPMDYPDANGEWIGFDADMARAIAKALGVEVEFVEIEWDNKIFELQNKSIDVVWNGMTLTDEVKKSMACTNPYLSNAQVVVLKSSVADQYADVESLKALNIAVESGSAGEAAATENGLNFTALGSQADALMEVAAGTSDAAIIDLLIASAMTGEKTSYPDMTFKFELTEEVYGVGCRVGSDLAAFINEQFETLQNNGTMENIAKTYGVLQALVQQ